MAAYGGEETVAEERAEGNDGSRHHTFKHQHHTRMAKLHHGIAKAHEMAAAHHQSMAGSQVDGDEGLDEEVTTANNNMTKGTPFGSRG